MLEANVHYKLTKPQAIQFSKPADTFAISAPNLQAHIERFIQSLQQEALDHFIVFGEKHFEQDIPHEHRPR